MLVKMMKKNGKLGIQRLVSNIFRLGIGKLDEGIRLESKD